MQLLFPARTDRHPKVVAMFKPIRNGCQLSVFFPVGDGKYSERSPSTRASVFSRSPDPNAVYGGGDQRAPTEIDESVRPECAKDRERLNPQKRLCDNHGVGQAIERYPLVRHARQTNPITGIAAFCPSTANDARLATRTKATAIPISPMRQPHAHLSENGWRGV
jgi:hypothetical protein